MLYPSEVDLIDGLISEILNRLYLFFSLQLSPPKGVSFGSSPCAYDSDCELMICFRTDKEGPQKVFVIKGGEKSILEWYQIRAR